MRNTWIILILTAVVAAGIYYYFTKKVEYAPYDVITISNTADSIKQKIRVFEADDPLEVYYRDSTWSVADSTKLKQILTNGSSDSVDRGYREKTFFLTYNDEVYYDMELRKPDTAVAFGIDLEFVKENDTMFVQGKLQQGKKNISFRNPMMRLYKSFVISYNDRLPDSVRNDSAREYSRTQATKIVTVIRP
ncbi:MAG: hypothetical protein EOO85_02045 [Pedobacter sp.]|nr:MAG: hypothetical protein EOO85_02045 [Pedobacter sp.]